LEQQAELLELKEKNVHLENTMETKPLKEIPEKPNPNTMM